jgi:serine/threonine-protein kinase RsbW
MKIELHSSLDQLSKVEQIVDAISDSINIEGDIYANILVGVTEAVNNSIVHGNKLSPDKKVSIEYTIHDKFVIFHISDQGPGFNYYTVPDPTIPENLEKESGRGIFLMNNLADEVIFNDTGNEVSLKFYIN